MGVGARQRGPVRITFLPKNIDGAGMYRGWFPAIAINNTNRHQMRCPSMAFYNKQGQQIPLVAGQLPDGWVNCGYADLPDADCFMLQMPLEDKHPQVIREFQAKGKKVVVELDDDYLHLPPYNPFVSQKNHDAKNLHKCVALADAVSVSTPSLRSSYKHLNKNITVLQNRLHWPMWQGVTPVYEQSWRKVRVGYMGRLDYHSADLDTIKPWFSRWLASHPQVEFVAAGDTRIHSYLGVPVERQVSTDQTDFRQLELADITATFDIGLVPLARNKFNESKSWLKGLEYSACGICTVATPTQQYRALLEDGAGYLASGRRQWIEALDELVESPELRRRIGEAARRKASACTYDRHVNEWLDFYDQLAPAPVLLWGDSDNPHPARTGVAA